MRILELLDWAKLIPALRRKRFFGYSDITALHLAFQTAVPGLVTFHGPMLVDGAGAIPQSDAARLQGAHSLLTASARTVSHYFRHSLACR